MEKELQSAIIGYWRQGATIEEIIGITGMFYLTVRRVIEEYKKKIEL